jgi:DNA-binding response OmpR family regulator
MAKQGKNLRLLAVDDDLEWCRLFLAAGQDLGYQVDSVPTIEQAYRLLQQAAECGRPYAAAILDLNFISGIKGIEVPLGKTAARKFKELYPGMACIMVSGADISLDSVLTLIDEHGLDYYLPKDRFDSDALRVAIEEGLRRSQSHRSFTSLD